MTAGRQETNTVAKNTSDNKKKKQKKIRLGFLYLFIFVFFIALMLLSFAVKRYSPDVDIAIENNKDISQDYPDTDYEIRPIDERLKWIQKEDDMPSVSIKKETDIDYNELFKNENETYKLSAGKKIKKHAENGEKNKKTEFNNAQKEVRTKEPETLALNDSIILQRKAGQTKEPSDTITKVYLGSYASLDEATDIRNNISSLGLAVSPFIKSVNNHYIVQVGSFYDSQKADDLVIILKTNGYNAKKQIEKR